MIGVLCHHQATPPSLSGFWSGGGRRCCCGGLFGGFAFADLLEVLLDVVLEL